MKLTANSTAKIISAIIKGLEVEVAKHTSEREYFYDYEQTSEGWTVVNIYPKEQLPDHVGDGATICIQDSWERDAPHSKILVIENSDFELEKVGVSHDSDDFEQQIAKVLALVIPTLLV
ncbi:hypothetical protein D3C71_77360 [compost metagenome]